MDKKFVSLMLVFFLAVGMFFTYTVFNTQIASFARAKEESVPSSSMSLMYYWPNTQVADGKSKVQINVFVRNSKGLPLENKQVTLSTSLGTIDPPVTATDKSGLASFDIVAGSPGHAIITASVDSQIQLQQKADIEFK